MRTSPLQKPFRYSYNNYAFVIIVVNVVVYLLNSINPQSRLYTAMIPGLVLDRGYIWQFFTYMFTHAGLSHILFNMLGIFFFGVQVERRMGSKEFLLFYLGSGLLAGIFSFVVYIFTGMYGVILLGASGAVFAVLLAFAVYYPHANIYLMGIFPIRAPVLVIGYTAIELFNQVFGMQSGVAHLTHLAGFGFAFLYFVIRLGINPIDSFRSGGRGGYWR
ncbi:MAG TPA: rhomboid family intramembrane serine protease [Sediminispirochaeta sp.]|nr:rhomboid family intramembrane serine protease [Sediminispirochaeta sp.]